MTELLKTPSSNYLEIKKDRDTSNLSNPKLSKLELKSNIPKPILYVRNKEPLTTENNHTSKNSQSVCRIPRAIQLTRRGRTSLSLQSRPSYTKKKDNAELLLKPSTAQPLSSKPNMLSGVTVKKNQYSNVKAKVDSKIQPKVQGQLSTSPHRTKSTTSRSSRMHSYMEPLPEQPEEERQACNEGLLEKQRQLLTAFNELKKIKPMKDLQLLEQEICRIVGRTCTMESAYQSNSSMLSEGAPDFLSAFEIKIQELVGLWLQLICDIISTEKTASSSASSQLSLPDPSLNLRAEIHRFLSHLPCKGEPLHMKLQRIEDEQFMAMTKVMHSFLEQTKQLNDLQDQYNRLEKTQDDIHFKMNEELAILSDENNKLDNKYTSAVEKYNMEKSKVEQMEKQKVLINKDTIEIKKMIKVMEGKCAEYEAKVKKADTTVKTLEITIRNKDVASETEGKQHRELINKSNELKETVSRLKSELAENDKARSSMETENKNMQTELASLKTLLDESVKKRNEMVEELAVNAKKLNEAEVQLNLTKNHTPSVTVSKDCKDEMDDSVAKNDLSTDIKQKKIEIEDLRGKLAAMERALKEKTSVEDRLRKQVADTNKQPHEVEGVLKSQIRDLQYSVKDLTEERAELEKIIAQKTLELDQRDLLCQQHSQVLRTRDDLIPMIQTRKRYNNECLERLRGFVFEQENMYFDERMQGNNNNDDQYVYQTMKAEDKLYSFDPKMVNKEMSFRQEKMTELFNLLEHKQMEMIRLERRMRDLQGAQNQRELTLKEQAACITSLHKALERHKSTKSRGFFSLLTGQESQTPNL